LKQEHTGRLGKGIESPPARGRGLKRALVAGDADHARSPPARGRGLKRIRRKANGPGEGRPPRGGVD